MNSENPHNMVNYSYLQTYLPKTYGCHHLSHTVEAKASQIHTKPSRQALAPRSLATKEPVGA